MPELELGTVFEAGTSLDPSISVEYEVCENGAATASSASSSVLVQQQSIKTTTNRLSPITTVTSTNTASAAAASQNKPLLEPPTLAEAKKSMKVLKTNAAMANSDVTFSVMV